ncbi:MAG: ABC transporter ATP-binding protein [Erysipelotrichales bacterium]|nr:ABC transporter ATP-binding protein [Erysipelotrichales bacterium]
MIDIRNVSKAFETKQVLNDLSLTIHSGTVLGLVGPNGSGKSTLLRLIAGILHADGGFLTLDEQPIYDNVNAKSKIFFVADEPFFFTGATLKDMKEFYQIFYPNFSEEAYRKALSIFSVSENSKIASMSKGMKRQVTLILALASGTEYLLLDEAFDGLDPMMRLNLKRIIADEIDSRKLTVIISSHNLRELEDICDTIGFLSDGNVVTTGSVDELKHSLHKVQFSVQANIEDIISKLDIVHKASTGSITTIVMRNSIDELKVLLEPYNPAIFEEIPLKLEEIFVYEMEAKGYGTYED